MEISSINRLQFRHNPNVFASKQEAITEFNKIFWEEKGNSSSDPYSLLAEPTILLYENEDEPNFLAGTTTKRNPHAILAIGVNSNNNSTYNENRYVFIDVHDIYTRINGNTKAIEDAIRILTAKALDSDSLLFFAQSGETGTLLSGDVRIAQDYRIYNTTEERWETLPNNLACADGVDNSQKGMYMYVDIDYVEGDSAFTFTVSHSDKTISEKKVTFHNNYVTAGTYDMKDQSIHLNLREGEEVVIDCAQLLDEWIADEGTKTPVILKKEENLYGEGQYNHVPKYQDILSADIRIKDELRDPNTGELLPPENGIYKKSSGSTNILSRTYDSRELYVDGKADNIIYYGADGKTNVKDELDKLNKLRISSDSKNIIVGKFDGFFASVDIEYEKIVEDGSTVQKLVLYTSGLDASGNVITNKAKEIEIPIAQFIDEVWYDESTEELVISYIDGKGDKRYTRISVSGLIDEWDVYNEAHSVKLQKQRSVGGKDLLSADVKITTSHPNNILVDVNHELYVRGEADNIKYANTTGSTSSSTTVQEAIDKLTKAVSDEITDRTADVIAEQTRAENAEAELQSSLDEEIANARDAENILTNKIGTGFTDDPHENITAKFNELNNNLNGEQTRAEEAENELRSSLTAEINRAEGVENDLRSSLTAEINRATSAENVLANKIGTGFTDQANANVTFKFNTLTDRVNAEESRAIAKENEINNKLDVEIADRIADVDAEEARAENAENILANKIGTGFTTADTNNVTAKFNTLTSNFNKEIQDRIDAVNEEETRATNVENDLRTDLTAETNRATSAETALNTAIANEKTRAEGAESILTTNLNTVSSKTDTNTAAIATEKTRAEEAEETLNEKIDNEISDRKEYAVHSAEYVKVDNAIYLKNSTGHVLSTINTTDFVIDGMVDRVEIQTISGVKYLVITFNTDAGKSDIKIPLTDIFNPSNYYTKDEVDASQAAQDSKISTISGNVNTINTTIGTGFSTSNTVTSKFNALSDKLDTEIADRIADVNAEETRAQSAETTLNTSITNEKNRATSAETALNTAITNEKTRAEGAETTLNTAITNEKTRATNAENALNGAITSEIADRIADVNAEETRAINAEATLNAAIDNEKTRAEGIESGLRTDLTAETTRATNAENALSGAITSEIADRIADVNAEETRAQSAETALNTAITNEKARVDAISSKTDTNTTAIATEKSRAEGIEQGLRNDVNTVSGKSNQEISDRKAYAFHDVEYSKTDKKIYFKNGNSNTIKTIDATDFIKDGMVENVVISDGKLIITFNTDSGKSDIEIPLASIFNPDNYYTKAEVNASQAAQDSKINTISGTATANAAAIATEKSRAEGVESSLRSDLTTETTNRSNGDTEIKNIIGGYSTANTVYQAITAETAARTGDVQTLKTSVSANTSAIVTEKTRAEGVEATLNTAITNEKARVDAVSSKTDTNTTAIATLRTDLTNVSGNVNTISGNVSTNTSNISTLSTSLTTVSGKADTNASNISTLTSNLSTESTNRANGDTEIKNIIGGYSTANTVYQAITAETAARTGDVQTLKTSATTNANNITALSGKIDTISGNTNKEISDRKAEAVHSADYVKGDNKIYLRNINGEELSTIDTTDFIVDGMIQDVYISGTSLVITWNTDATHTPTTVTIPFSQIFDPNNYYTKVEVDASQASQDSRISKLENDVSTISGDVNTITGQVQTLNEKIENEINRSMTADTNHNDRISTLERQIISATGATSDVSAALQDEISRASNAESALGGRIDNVTASTLTIQKNGVVLSPTYNPGGGAKTINVEVPTSLSDFTENGRSVTLLKEYSSGNLALPGTLTVNGTITATNAVYSSDVKLKENINSVDYIKKTAANNVEIKSFNFKDDPNKIKVYGVIAQEVEAQGLEEVVITKDDGYKAVDYTSLMMLKISYLEKENKELRSMIEDIQKKLG